MPSKRRTKKKAPSAKKAPAPSAAVRRSKGAQEAAFDEGAWLEASASDFTAAALATEEGLKRATDVLERALHVPELSESTAWLERAMAPFHVDFVFELAGLQHGLLRTAGALHLKLRHPASAARLLERLEAGFMQHDADRYPLYLIGRLGSPDLVPEVSAWFLGRPVRSIAHAGFPLYRLMTDLLVRQQCAEVVEHIQQVIADHEAGRVFLSKHHRFAYDAALGSISGDGDHRWQPAPIADPS